MAGGIAVPVLAAGGLTAAAAATTGVVPPSTIVLGTFVTGAMLHLVALANEPVAARFATLVLITALLTSGYLVARRVAGLLT